jgi:peptidoglycan/xylan/chitin deacetylase (PgdA/CDA1 family)
MMKAVMYHYVRNADPQFPYFSHLPFENFTRQVQYLAETFQLLGKDEFLESVASGTPRQGVVLTFDDGFRDHFDFVFPFLEKNDYWGIFYIPTGPYGGDRLLDVHRTHILLGKYGGAFIHKRISERLKVEMLNHAHVDEFRRLTYQRQKNDDDTLLVKRILNYFIHPSFRTPLLDDLMAELVPNEKDLKDGFYMRPEELRRLQDSGNIIGSHGVTHTVMSKLSVEDQENEITASFKTLESFTGGLPVHTFCYPYGGAHSFTAETEKLLSDHGCVFSFDVKSQDIDAAALVQRPQALPRYDTNQFQFGSLERVPG